MISADEGAFSSRGGPSPVEGRDHQEVAPVERARAEGGAGEHQQHVADAQDDLAELARRPARSARWIAIDRAAVAPAEADLLQGAARRAPSPARPRPRRAGGRWPSPPPAKWRSSADARPAHLLQVEHPADVAREREPVARGEDLVGAHRRDPVAVALDLDQVDALQVAQAALGDALAGDAAASSVDDHLDRELARIGVGGLAGRAALGQQERRQQDHRDEAERPRRAGPPCRSRRAPAAG